MISGATIVAAEKLIGNTADIAINWYGGWHHAKRYIMTFMFFFF